MNNKMSFGSSACCHEDNMSHDCFAHLIFLVQVDLTWYINIRSRWGLVNISPFFINHFSLYWLDATLLYTVCKCNKSKTDNGSENLVELKKHNRKAPWNKRKKLARTVLHIKSVSEIQSCDWLIFFHQTCWIYWIYHDLQCWSKW